MSRNIQTILETDTFQEWFNKTNLLIETAQDTLTIGEGEVNSGNVYLTGDMSVQNIKFNELSVENDLLDTIKINNSVELNSDLVYPLKLSTALTPLTLNTGGMKIAYAIDGTVAWEVGPAVDPSSFEIKAPAGGFSLQLNTNDNLTSATLTGTSIVISDDILPSQISANTTGSAASCNKWSSARTVNFATGDVTGSFSIDGSQDINNVVLTVSDNSHKHTIANISGLQDALDGKLPNSSIMGNLQNLAVKQYGLIAKTGDAEVALLEIKSGSGIIVTNGKGVGGNPTITHQSGPSGLASIDNSSASSKFIKNIAVDSFGHISSMQSGDVPLGQTFTSSDRSIVASDKESLSHGLNALPSLVKIYLKCITTDGNFSKGSLIPYECISNTQLLGVAVTSSAIKYAIGPTATISVIDPVAGGFVTLTNAKWKIVFKAWV